MDSVEAYNKICNQDDPYYAYHLVNVLERQGLEVSSGWFWGVLDKKYHNSARQNIQQTILRSARRSIMKPLIRFCAGDETRQSYPLPNQWLNTLEKNNVHVDRTWSRFAFLKEQCRSWFRALVTLKSRIVCGLKSYDDIEHSYQMFPDLPKQACSTQDGCYSFVNWLNNAKEWNEKEPLYVTSRDQFDGGVVKRQKYILPKLSRVGLFCFFLESLWLFAFGALKWLFGAWFMPFLMPELISVAYFKRVKNSARRYGFNNSGFAIRPLWTSIAEDRGADVFLYFYSSNVNVFYARQDKVSPPSPGYISMSWPSYWVVDEDQKRFLNDQCGIENDVQIKGVIDFTDSDDCVLDVEGKTIALFDIPVYNRDYIANLGLIAPFYTPDIIGQFVDDVIEVAKSQGYKILWKVKRDMTANTNASSYSSVVEKYENDLHVIMVSPSVNARRIIERTDLLISIPYTSTAIIGKEMDKKTVYYDPTNSLSYFDGLSHDLPVIQGRESLEQLLKSA